MCVCVCVCVHVCALCVCVCVCVYMCVHCVCVCVCVYVCVHCVCMCMCMHVCVYVCVCVFSCRCRNVQWRKGIVFERMQMLFFFMLSWFTFIQVYVVIATKSSYLWAAVCVSSCLLFNNVFEKHACLNHKTNTALT